MGQGTPRCGHESSDTACYGMGRCGMGCYGMGCYGMGCYGMGCYGMMNYMVCHGMRHAKAWAH